MLKFYMPAIYMHSVWCKFRFAINISSAYNKFFLLLRAKEFFNKSFFHLFNDLNIKNFVKKMHVSCSALVYSFVS